MFCHVLRVFLCYAVIPCLIKSKKGSLSSSTSSSPTVCVCQGSNERTRFHETRFTLCFRALRGETENARRDAMQEEELTENKQRADPPRKRRAEKRCGSGKGSPKLTIEKSALIPWCRHPERRLPPPPLTTPRHVQENRVEFSSFTSLVKRAAVKIYATQSDTASN